MWCFNDASQSMQSLRKLQQKRNHFYGCRIILYARKLSHLCGSFFCPHTPVSHPAGRIPSPCRPLFSVFPADSGFQCFQDFLTSSFMAGKFFKTRTAISCPPRNTSCKSIEQRLLQVPKTVQQGWTAVRAPFKRSAFAKGRRNQTSLLPFCWYLLRLWFAFAGSISGRTWMQCSDKKNFLLWWFYRKSESTKKSLHMAERNKKVLYEVKRFFYGFPAQAQDFSL